jgi:lipopolysaccharide/colanic/teichoic acid biosynthesis glycosyltransferase
VTAIEGPAAGAARKPPTIWGCTPQQAHDRYWAAFGVQVVRQHERSEIVAGAELFLLCEPHTLVRFRLTQVLETIYWLNPGLVVLRARDARPRDYREVAVTQGDRLVRFERVYGDARARSARVALTPDREVAKLWQNAPDVRSPWRWLRSQIAPDRRIVRAVTARVYDEGDDEQVMECMKDLTKFWKRPDMTIPRALEVRGEAVIDPTAEVDSDAVLIGPAWVGAGRRVQAGTHVVGPVVLWDDPDSCPTLDEVRWLDIEPAAPAYSGGRRIHASAVPGKRAFDVAFSLVAVALTLPVCSLVALAILLEDGRPVFFTQRRETTDGRDFPCLKFRSMRTDSEILKEQLQQSNEADGPQFFMKEDPRVTRVGRIIRKLQIDELPQFLNVLAGHMSIVGPRPLAYKENQYCPPWREARLSVRPGLTGLWQVSRTRRHGLDFQEWIKFDLEYVEHATWAMDLKIIGRTVLGMLAAAFARSSRAADGEST